MAEQIKGLVISESEYVKVKDAAGVVQEHPVPKAWIGTALLPEGIKAAAKAEADKADEGSQES